MSGESFHRLWVTVSVLAATACLAMVLVAERRERGIRRRTAAVLAVDRVTGRSRRGLLSPSSAKAWGPPVGAFLACWFLVGGVIGAALGSAAALGLRRWLSTRKPSDDRAVAEEAARRLPLAADLLAACAAAGAGPREAAEAVGDSLGGPVGDRLARAAAEIALGGEPAVAWGRFGEIPGAAGLARCLERACATGAPAAEPVARLAEGLRAERSRRATARAQRAQVLITGPVGLCFLPAFLSVGVAPVVMGLAEGLLHGS